MKAIIKIGKGLNSIVLKYEGIKKVYRQDLHIVVYLEESYIIDKKELLRRYNVSTTPYMHVFYDAMIWAVYN